MERRQGGQAERMSEPKNSKDALEFIHTLDSLAIKKQQEEIERLCAWGRGLESDLSHARVEISFLKAEVERLNLLTAEMDKTINISQAGCRLLKAEVESLHKAGDEMAKRTEFFQKRWDADELCQEVEAWNAAKEGKPSV